MTPISKCYLDHAEAKLAEFVRRIATMRDGRKIVEVKREAQELLRETGWAR